MTGMYTLMLLYLHTGINNVLLYAMIIINKYDKSARFQ